MLRHCWFDYMQNEIFQIQLQVGTRETTEPAVQPGHGSRNGEARPGIGEARE